MSVKLLSPLIPPSMTTAQRNAIPAGRRPKGAMIFNTTTNRIEFNRGSDASPIWLPEGAIDFQRLLGNYNGYLGPFSPTSENMLYTHPDGLTPIQLTYTPPIDAWWDVTLQAGLVQKADANYNYAQIHQKMLTPDADGDQYGYHYINQHLSVQTYEGYSVRKLWKLAAGVSYTVRAQIIVNGGSWQYYAGPAHLWIQGIAHPR